MTAPKGYAKESVLACVKALGTPTPRTDAVRLPINSHLLPHDVVHADFARKLETELAEQQWLHESAVKRAKELAEELAAANARAADWARIVDDRNAQLACERETSRLRLRLLAMHERDDGFTQTRKRLSALETALATERAERAESELALLKSKFERHCREYNDRLAERRYAENMQRQAEAEVARLRSTTGNTITSMVWPPAGLTPGEFAAMAAVEQQAKKVTPPAQS